MNWPNTARIAIKHSFENLGRAFRMCRPEDSSTNRH